MKKVLKTCAVLTAICVMTAVIIAFVRHGSDLPHSIVEAGAYIFVLGFSWFFMWLTFENDWSSFKYGWRWKNGRLSYGQVDYTTIPKERRTMISRIVTLIVAALELCIAILLLHKQS